MNTETSRLRPWADLVFHVLAHVPARRPVPASVHDPVYTAFVRDHLGPATDRHLGDDASALSALVSTHDALVAVQWLAWLFPSVEAAFGVAELEIAQLPAESTAEPKLIPRLLKHRQAAELLWASVLLEAEWHARLPEVHLSLPELDQALSSAAAVAPRLADCTVAFVRALRLHGRVRSHEIWVGAPLPALRLGIEHVVWQACHEATVLEVNEAAARTGIELGHGPSEHAAVVLLAERAKRHRQAAQHASWLAHFGANAPPTDRSALDSAALLMVVQLAEGR
ncbi:MAG: hypothetical protein HY898_19215 [Deltaproteobacteria bacterium]|nr:hypothetical protein [Deltaproteobacteria bacterium]